MNSAEMSRTSAQPEKPKGTSSSIASPRRPSPRSHILRLLRGALDARPNETLVSMRRDALASIAGELERLGTVLRQDRLWNPLDVARFLSTETLSETGALDWSGTPGSNRRPSPWQGDAASASLRPDALRAA